MILYTLNEISVALWCCTSVIEVYLVIRAIMVDAKYYPEGVLDDFQKYCDKRIQTINRQVGK